MSRIHHKDGGRSRGKRRDDRNGRKLVAVSVSHVTKAFTDKQTLLPKWMTTHAKEKVFYAVKDVSLRVAKGETYGLLGPNGSGKSTLIRMLATLLVPDSGEIRILGKDVIAQAEWVKRRINRVSVDASFFKSLSAKENLLYAARLYGLDARAAMQRMRAILQELEFPEEKLDEPMYKYSRGLQQKVAIARGFLTEPEVILLDEPTTGLDPKSKLDVQKFLTRIREELNLSVVLTSHDMEEVEKLCSRIGIIDDGRIIAEGTSEELKRLVQEEEIYEIQTTKPGKILEILKALRSIDYAYREDGSVRFLTKDLDTALQEVAQALKEARISFKGMRALTPTLEDVFLELTGKSLKEEAR